MIKQYNGMLERLFKLLIKGYQRLISPLLPARCRYYPTCSQYGLHAIAWHGSRRGGWLLLKRLSRCHPLGGHGVDFVPLPLYRYTYHYMSDEIYPQYKQFVYIDRMSYPYHLNLWLT